MKPFARRSAKTELIDEPNVPFEDWAVCLKELNTINTLLGGHAITIQGVQQLLPGKNNSITIAEIGCGGGDNLKAIHRWNHGRYKINYTGIDLNEACIDFARKRCKELPGLQMVCADYRQVNFNEKVPDIIFSSLFCHHFADEDLVDMLVWLKQHARVGFIINDLQRHPVAFHSIKLLTKLFSRSYLVRNDAPVSVMRGFKKQEWERLMQRAGITNYSVRWKWAFRYLIVVKNE